MFISLGGRSIQSVSIGDGQFYRQLSRHIGGQTAIEIVVFFIRQI